MKIAYIAHPISGDIEGNLAKIRAIVKHINETMPDVVPFVPYYVDVVSCDDNDIKIRKRCILNDMELFMRTVMDEVWVYGDPEKSSGIKTEIEWASIKEIPVIYKDKFPEPLKKLEPEWTYPVMSAEEFNNELKKKKP